MSVDLCVYVKGPARLTRRALVDALRAVGWHAVFVDDSSTALPPDEEIAHDTLIAARSAEVCESARLALASDDHKRWASLSQENEIGSLWLSYDAEFSAEEVWPAKELRRLEAAGGKAFAGKLRDSDAEYVLNSGSGCTVMDEVWRVLGQLTGGLMDDPQTGAWCEWREGRLVYLVQPPPDANPFREFFEAAHAQGVPFDPIGSDPLGDIRSDLLEPAALEALLVLARKMLSKVEYSAVVPMIIADYAAKKGAHFLKENRAWIEDLKERFL